MDNTATDSSATDSSATDSSATHSSATDNSATEKHDSTAEVNTRPGPQDRGGHGGMATREQEAREQREAEQTDH